MNDRLISKAKALINKVEAYEANASYVLRDEFQGMMEAANTMFTSGKSLTALRARLSKGAVPVGTDLTSLTMTTGDAEIDSLLEQIKHAKNKAFSLGNKFVKKASDL